MRRLLLLIAPVVAAALVPAGATAEPGVAEAERAYVVVLHRGNSSKQVAEEHGRTRRAKVQQVFELALNGYSADIPDTEVENLRKDKRVALVEPVTTITATAQTLPWGIDRVNADSSPTANINGVDQRVNMDVYVLDTGIAAHPDLNVANGHSVIGGPAGDCGNHGTHIAGTAGAIDNTSHVVGVAPGVRVHPVKVLDCGGSGTNASAIAGIEWALSQSGRKVLNMSFVGDPNQALDAAVINAVDNGAVAVIAAGNDGFDACGYSPGRTGTTAGVLTVGASNKRDRRPSWSNRGNCVDVYAPGTGVLSTTANGGQGNATGTSMSAPHVSGAAALLLAANGGWTPAQVEDRIRSTARPAGTASRPIGILNVATF